MVNGRICDDDKIKSDNIFLTTNLPVFQHFIPSYRWNEKIAIKKTHHFQLALVDTLGNHKERIQELPLEIKNICWAPDGKQLAWQTGSDTTSNIWLWDLGSKQPVRLTFNDAKKLVGWSSTMSLFYTTKYPDFLLKINPAFAEYQEFINAIQGQNFESQLFEIKNSKRQMLCSRLKRCQ